MFSKRGFLSDIFCVFLTLTLIFGPFLTVKNTIARDVLPIFIGDGIATGAAFLVAGSGQRFRMGPYPIPVFDNSRVQTGEGSAVITLVPDVLVEVREETDILFKKTGKNNALEIVRGVIRFSIPPQNALAIITPNASISVGTHSRLAAGTGLVSTGRTDTSGIVGVLGGKTYIESTKGLFEVTLGDGTSRVLEPGDSIRLAKADTTMADQRGELLAGLTTVYQLENLSLEDGVRVVLGEGVPSLSEDDVCLVIPDVLGGGFIIGLPDALAVALNATLITIGVTPADVAEKGMERCKRSAGGGWSWVVVAVGAAAAGVGAAAAGGGGGEEYVASPSE